MAGKRAKKNKYQALSVDRISRLPDCVIHHILSFVPTVDAVRMSIVSKRYRRMWLFVPVLEFSHEVGFERPMSLNVFVGKCLKHRRKASRFIEGSAVTTFKLETVCSYKWLVGLSKWFDSNVIMNTIRDLDICLLPEESNQKVYSLPSAVMNGRSLTSLKLNGHLKISASCSVNLPSLKSLCLKGIDLGDDCIILSKLIIGCPSLETCLFNDTDTEYCIKISSLSLRFLEVGANFMSLYIKARNLQSLQLMKFIGEKLDFSACKAIRDLTINELPGYNTRIEKIEDQISKLPLLENMTLHIRRQQLNISSCSLKHFTLYNDFEASDDEDELYLTITINTPDLISFSYEGFMKVRMPRARCNRAEGYFEVRGSSSDLIGFLSEIAPIWGSFDLCLRSSNYKAGFDLPKNLKEISLPSWPYLKHMEVEFLCKWTRKAEFRNFLKRHAPALKTLSVK